MSFDELLGWLWRCGVFLGSCPRAEVIVVIEKPCMLTTLHVVLHETVWLPENAM